jgi:hypothetical protein
VRGLGKLRQIAAHSGREPAAGAKRRDRRWQLIGDDQRHAHAYESHERQYSRRGRGKSCGEQQADRDSDDDSR